MIGVEIKEGLDITTIAIVTCIDDEINVTAYALELWPQVAYELNHYAQTESDQFGDILRCFVMLPEVETIQ